MDLNVDIGEGFAFDEALLQFASSANVCCGVHAGSVELTAHTVEICLRKDVRIGMHPGYPDRANMGRRDPAPHEQSAFSTSILAQVTWFASSFACSYIKPHGAWYNAIASGDPFAVELVERVLGQVPLPLMQLQRIAPPIGEPVQEPREGGGWFVPPFGQISEGFADRTYLPDGRLMPRSQPGAVLHDPDLISAQVLKLAPRVDSICLHGDTPNALEFAERVYKTLVDHGYEVGA